MELVLLCLAYFTPHDVPGAGGKGKGELLFNWRKVSVTQNEYVLEIKYTIGISILG